MALVAEFGCIRLVTLSNKLSAAGVLGVEMNTQAKGRNKYNLMDHAFFDDLHFAFEHISTGMGDEVRAAVLYSTPVGAAHFSAGLNLKSVTTEFIGADTSMIDKLKLGAAIAMKSTAPPAVRGPAFPAMKQMKLRRMIKKWQDATSSIARCRVPVIGVLNQSSYGGAIDVACACDIRIASQSAKMTVQEAKVGIVADLGTLQRLPHIVGQGVAREWAFTGRLILPDEALRRGFVNEVLPTDEKALEHAIGIAAEIAKECSPLAVQGTKEILNHDIERQVQDGLDNVRAFNSAFLLNDDVVASSLKFMSKSSEAAKWSCRVIDANPMEPKRGSKPASGKSSFGDDDGADDAAAKGGDQSKAEGKATKQ